MSSAHVLMLFGATGDLALNKILPAVSQWFEDYSENQDAIADQVTNLPPYSHILCLGRRPYDTVAYLDHLQAHNGVQVHPELLSRLTYLQMDFDDPKSYSSLAQFITKELGPPQRLHLSLYLAVKPEMFPKIPLALANEGLLIKGYRAHQLIFEKPFGADLKSAQTIQAKLATTADETQIYRIDHYLGKEMIRNILALRFTNRLFEESWNGRAIAEVHILSSETAGVDERLDYYDQIGAISDMLQSHLLQLMSLVAMECPSAASGRLDAEHVRTSKLQFLSQLNQTAPESLIIGQYEGYPPAQPENNEVPSRTETYVRATWRLNWPQWENTRFVLETGKHMAEKRTEIRLTFRPHSFCAQNDIFGKVLPNEIIIAVHPEEGIHLRFNSKAPGYGLHVEPVHAHYCHACRFSGNRPEAYVKLLQDLSSNDKTLFTSFEELSLQWQITDRLKILASTQPLHVYPTGHPPESPLTVRKEF